MADAKKILRSELYRLVWLEPMTRLAKIYGLSDVGLAKICRKHDIPRPPRGYWAKKQFGQQPKQTPLPKAERDLKIELREYNSKTAAIQQLTQSEVQKSNDPPVLVAETLRGCHALVSKANEELQRAQTDSQGLIDHRETHTLHITTSKAALHRVLLIADALLKFFEAKGYEVHRGPCVAVLGQTIHFIFTEQLDVQQTLKEPDLDGEYEFGHSRFDVSRVPSGRLTLIITEGSEYWARGARHTWRDTEKQKLEDRLNQFVTGVIEMAAIDALQFFRDGGCSSVNMRSQRLPESRESLLKAAFEFAAAPGVVRRADILKDDFRFIQAAAQRLSRQLRSGGVGGIAPPLGDFRRQVGCANVCLEATRRLV